MKLHKMASLNEIKVQSGKENIGDLDIPKMYYGFRVKIKFSYFQHMFDFPIEIFEFEIKQCKYATKVNILLMYFPRLNNLSPAVTQESKTVFAWSKNVVRM